mmetsp:Transcript_8421/g.15390  ORF Transcript_8421/g.15390 Transcript_8421/m.15390 type:complete len:138 (+) Transcript_8421:33-446(+)
MGAANCYSCSCNCDDQNADDRGSFAILQTKAAMCPSDGLDDGLADAIAGATARTSYLEVVFELPDAVRTTRIFTRRPLGLDFNRHVPVTIKRVRPGTQANEVGVHEGWKILSINGYDVTRAPFQEVYLALKNAAEIL